jgi:hypothetical protein
MKKRGAIDLSMSTIVIVIIGVVVLALGIGLISKMSCNISRGIDSLNEASKEQIFDMFTQDQKLVVKEIKNEVHKGLNYNVGFGIRDNEGSSAKYSYVVEADDLGQCDFTGEIANNFIVLGKSQEDVQFSEKYAGLITFSIPVETKNCILSYKITVNKDNQFYDAKGFQVEILNKGVMRSLC